MKRFRILRAVLRKTHANEIIGVFLGFFFICALIILLVEPDITRYGDALWYCYAVVSTIGFGDFIAVTFIGKLCSVLLTVYSLFVIAIATGVVVSFYQNLVEQQKNETTTQFLDKLERLDELSKEELKEISEKVKKWH